MCAHITQLCGSKNKTKNRDTLMIGGKVTNEVPATMNSVDMLNALCVNR